MKQHINLNDFSTNPEEEITKDDVQQKNLKLLENLIDIQNKLFAQRKYSVLVVLQGMDTSGKDGAVKHVFSGLNPMGCNVTAFKKPSEEEAAHHFLWRINKVCPAKGYFHIFNRSYYEDILVPYVNKSLNESELNDRCDEINMFEKGLINNNTIIFKFYLHVSHKEQIERLNERKTDAHKRWKYQKEDVIAIAMHKEYKKAYNFLFEKCSKSAPWHIVPSDKKWYKNYMILYEIVKKLEKYEIDYPVIKI
ncbi:MAG: polyphosphate kinase [Bacteroidota bacterium]|nr:polyphosphate kinase [Bacteroidota bacterium]